MVEKDAAFRVFKDLGLLTLHHKNISVYHRIVWKKYLTFPLSQRREGLDTNDEIERVEIEKDFAKSIIGGTSYAYIYVSKI